MYRRVSLVLALSFGLAGSLFLFFPGVVVEFFNGLSTTLNMAPSPPDGMGFYLALAVGYMYLVTVIAFLMYRHPADRSFPLLLIHGKLATSTLSLYLFFVHGPYLIYIANAAVDGCIGLMLIPLYGALRRKAQ
jgi:hypothetical protein